MKFVIKGYRAACQMFGLQPRESNLSLLSHFSVRSLRTVHVRKKCFVI